MTPARAFFSGPTLRETLFPPNSFTSPRTEPDPMSIHQGRSIKKVWDSSLVILAGNSNLQTQCYNIWYMYVQKK